FFTYLYRKNGQIYQYNSSPMLNNNRIIREITHQYKYAIEDAMGGWNPRLF
ncbi:bacteriocin, partial [Campylobacter jejuni subsp. jejuni]